MSPAVSRKIRFGFAAGLPESLQAWRELARKAEDLGYDVIHVADHMGRQWSPLLALLSAAEATTRLRVGTQVIANDFRIPVVLAKEIATLDLLTGGRFECGIGVGHPATSPTGRSDYNQIGMEMDEPGPRVGRLAESLRLIKRFMASDGAVRLRRQVLPRRRHRAVPEAGAAPATADHGGGRRAAHAAVGGSGGRHHQHRAAAADGGADVARLDELRPGHPRRVGADQRGRG